MMFTFLFITVICSASLILVRPSFFKFLLQFSSTVPSTHITRRITSPVEHSTCANLLVISFYTSAFHQISVLGTVLISRMDMSLQSGSCGHFSPILHLVSKAPYHNGMLSISISCSLITLLLQFFSNLIDNEIMSFCDQAFVHPAFVEYVSIIFNSISGPSASSFFHIRVTSVFVIH